MLKDMGNSGGIGGHGIKCGRKGFVGVTVFYRQKREVK